MEIATNRMTLEEYLTYTDGADNQHELVAGELVEMQPQSPLNVQISLFLLAHLLQFVPINCLSNKVEIVVSGLRATTRVPDLTVFTVELADALRDAKRSTILLDMPPPLLVVEVVSPGKTNEDRDYRYKRSEYAARGIAEYWIVDPMRAQVTVLTLVDGLYEEKVFCGEERVASLNFPALELNVTQILTAGTPSNAG